MNGKLAGYIVMATKKKRSNDIVEYHTPLAYGTDPQPGIDRLLMGRGATLFKTEGRAIDALRISLEAKESSVWAKKHVFVICPVWENK